MRYYIIVCVITKECVLLILNSMRYYKIVCAIINSMRYYKIVRVIIN